MKTILITLLALLAVWFGFVAGRKTSDWTNRLYQNGAKAGEAVNDLQEVYDQHECARRNQIVGYSEALRQRRLQEQHEREVHDAMMNEIARLQQTERKHTEK